MAVWLPEYPGLAPVLTIASNSAYLSSHPNPENNYSALNDQFVPQRSNHESSAYFSWKDQKGSDEWVEYQFRHTQTVSRIDVFWFEDDEEDGVRVPEQWRLLYQDHGEWMPVISNSGYPVEIDQYNSVQFEPVYTNALRLEIKLQDGHNAGILEWQVF